nr:DUF2202 domain-containing protein [uncultured Methanoregula sp.]
MKKSRLLLIGGAVIVVIVIIAVLATGSGNPAQGIRAGYGQSVGHGQGQGYGTGSGTNYPVLLPNTNPAPLTATESADILFMREEEQLAHDLYVRWFGMYTIPVFSNIASSETLHVDEVRLLMDRYGLPSSRIGNASTGYHDSTIQSLYSTLSQKGDVSLTGAFEAGLAVEERDIADLDRALANTTRADIIQVYSNLRQGSENHKSAFLRQLGR